MAYVARTISDETQTLVGQQGDVSVNNPSHLVVTIDLSSATWNTVATHEVLTVTGGVSMQNWVVCTESLTSGGAATIKFGFEGNTGVFCAAIGYAGIDAGEFLDAAAGDFVTGLAQPVAFYQYSQAIVYGLDIGYEIEAAALTNGTLEWHCVWTPLTTGATVVAGAGGAL